MKLTENKFLLSLLILAVYFTCSYGWDIKRFFLPDLFAENPYLRDTSVQLTFFLIVPLLVMVALYGWKKLPTELGIDRGLRKALIFALVATAPMAIGYAVVADFQWSLSTPGFLYGCLQASIAEEILFRAFLFGLLYRKAGWGLWPATLVDGLLFGLVHIYQGDTVLDAALVFVVTSSGGVWFSWLFKEWNWNLWVPIFLHFFMNFYWSGFQMAENAGGGLWANVFRIMTIAFTVVVTLRPTLKLRFGPRLAVE